MGKRAESRAVGAPASGPGLCKCPCSPPIPRSSRGPGVAGPRSADSRLAHKNGLCFLAGGRACGVGGGSLAIAQRLQRLQPSRCPPSTPVRARDVPRLAATPQTQHGGPARPPDGVGAPRERESERASERGGGPPGQPPRDPRPGAPSPPSLRRPAARRRASAPSVPARATRARGGLGAAMIVSGRSGGTPLRRSWPYAA